MSSYCAPDDLYDYGLPRGAISNPGRLISNVSVSDTLTLDQHGFALNDEVEFRADQGGTLPPPLVEDTTYYAIPVSQNVFSVAAEVDGDAIDFTDMGEYVLVITPLPFAKAIEWASAQVDDMLPSHVVPLVEPYPPTIVMTTAELAAHKLTTLMGNTSDSLSLQFDNAQKRLQRWAKGVPLRGENVPAAANLARSATAPGLDRRGWHNTDGSIP